MLPNRNEYEDLLDYFGEGSPEQEIEDLRTQCHEDLFFLLRYAMGREDIDREWLFERCREVQASPNGHLDLWAREHYKSTIITFGLTIQDILKDPEITVGIFSHTRPIAKAFLKQIKAELETNERLLTWFPNVLWQPGERPLSVPWSLDTGITVKRKSNPKEATVEAYGLVDGQPTSKHFSLVVYDDVVTRESVTTPEMITKTTEAWELSLNLGSEDGVERYIGTRYHANDSYDTMLTREVVKPRIYPATHNGKPDGEPVLLTKEKLAKKRAAMGPYTFGSQMMQDPTADSTQGFDVDWLRYYEGAPDIIARACNIYILVDASSGKKDGDYTAMWVWGLHEDGNLYWLDGIRDRLNLTKRAKRLMAMHRQWRPNAVGYERYGMMADIEYVYEVQDRENYRFSIEEVGGSQPKEDRIRRLIPYFEQGHIYIPRHLLRTSSEGTSVDLVKSFVEEEFTRFPVAPHDDMLDAASRLFDVSHAWPEVDDGYEEPREWDQHTGY